MQNSISVLRLKFSAKNPAHRQYAARCDEIPSGFRHIARRLCRPKPFQGLRTSEGFAKCKTLRKASGRYGQGEKQQPNLNMESKELNKLAEVEQQLETLETEVKKFANGLPYWAKYIAEKILSGNAISDNDIDTSYSFLLEELKLKEETEKPEIEINYNSASEGNHKSDLLITKLENVEGVNALTENQTIDFSSNLTIIYGANGSGKSGYARLLKKAFYSKAEEDILPNVHLESGHKIVNAKFTLPAQAVFNLMIWSWYFSWH